MTLAPHQEYMQARPVWRRSRLEDVDEQGTASERQPLSRGSRGGARNSSKAAMSDRSSIFSEISGSESDPDWDSEEDGNPNQGWFSRLEKVVALHGASYFGYLLKWLVPATCFGVSFCIQNLLLHIATYIYVQWMYRLEESLASNKFEVTATSSGVQLSSKIGEGALNDLSAMVFGFRPVPMLLIDCLSLSVPTVWLGGVLWRLDLHLFTKCCFCGSFLAIGKGCFSVLTVVPDSIGWGACKARLGKDGVAWFSNSSNVNFDNVPDSLHSLGELLIITVVPPSMSHYRILRFCADMIYSGHTYFVALFSLGLYDMFRGITQYWKHRLLWRGLLGMVLMLLVLADITLILLNKFHYSIDVVLAIIVVFLYYTNAAISRSVAWWADEVWVPKGNRLAVKSYSGNGEIFIPPCFCPFCLMSGRYTIQNTSNESFLQHATSIYHANLAVDDPESFFDHLHKVVAFHESDCDFPGKLCKRDVVKLVEQCEKIKGQMNELKGRFTKPTVNQLLENTEVVHGGPTYNW